MGKSSSGCWLLILNSSGGENYWFCLIGLMTIISYYSILFSASKNFEWNHLIAWSLNTGLAEVGYTECFEAGWIYQTGTVVERRCGWTRTSRSEFNLCSIDYWNFWTMLWFQTDWIRISHWALTSSFKSPAASSLLDPLSTPFGLIKDPSLDLRKRYWKRIDLSDAFTC